MPGNYYVCAGSYISFCSRGRLTFLSVELSYFLFSFFVEVGLCSLLTKGKNPNRFRKNKIPFLGARNSACLLGGTGSSRPGHLQHVRHGESVPWRTRRPFDLAQGRQCAP